MWWRLARSEFNRCKGAKNQRSLQALVHAGREPGILAYVDGMPAMWCAVSPREELPALERSRILARVDDAPVWSIVCFFVARTFRRRGLTVPLIEAAAAHVAAHGARVVEAYPVEPHGTLPAAFAWTGLASAFRRAGFVEVERRSPTRPIMRRTVKGHQR
jgi:GNAT superfamily N-acetyltransferase